MASFVSIISGIATLLSGTATSAGGANAGEIVQLGTDGRLSQSLTPVAITSTPAAAGTATLDLGLSNEQRITMPAGNITIALSNDTNTKRFIISITQDATGGRTVTWFAGISWAGGVVPPLTTVASKRDVFGFIRTGAGTYDGFIVGNNI